MVSVTDGEIVCIKLAMILSDAGKDENIRFVRNLANDWQVSAVLHYYCLRTLGKTVNDSLIDEEAF